MTPILLDTIVGIVILLSIIVAFFRGFIKEMLTIINLGAAAAAAYFLGPQAVPLFRDWLGVTPTGEGKLEKAKDIGGVIPPEVMANFLAFGCVFFGVFIILTLAGMAISSSIKALGLGPLDRVLGMAFGAARGFLLIFLIYLPFGFFMQADQLPAWAKDSVSVALLDKAYKTGQEYLDDKEKNKDSSDDHAEKPIDPDSLRGKLHKIANDMMPKSSTDNPPAQEGEILRDDEKGSTP